MPTNAESPGTLNRLPNPVAYGTLVLQPPQSNFPSATPISNLVEFSECADKSVSTTSQMCISENSHVEFINQKAPATILCIAPCLSVRGDECKFIGIPVDRIAPPTDRQENLHEVHQGNVQNRSRIHRTVQSLPNEQPMEVGEEDRSSGNTEQREWNREQTDQTNNKQTSLEQREWRNLEFQFLEPDWQDLAQWQALLRSQYLFSQEEVRDLNHSILPVGLDPNPQAVIPSGIIRTQHLYLASQAMYAMMETEQERPLN